MTSDTSIPDQIALQLPVEAALHSDVVLTGSSNAEAIRWLDYWPKWPGPARALNIFGPEGAGKSHLARFFAAKTGAVLMPRLTYFTSDMLNSSHIILDDVAVDDSWNSEALFHLFNWITENDGSLLLFSKEPVARLNWGLQDLVSRLKTSAAQEIYPPDDDYLADYLQHLFAKRQCHVSPSIVQYIITRIPRHFGFAMQLVDALDKSSLVQKKPISLKLVKSTLAELVE